MLSFAVTVIAFAPRLRVAAPAARRYGRHVRMASTLPTTPTTSTPKSFEELDTSSSLADRFVMQRTEEIAERGITISMYNHEPTGAQIMLIDAPDENKCFSCNFRTLPKDNTGVPHILEHSVLCGSTRYPSKEPFVDLLKGSLKTFLNAMTAADKTMYPVASQNKQDFFNLVNVYMDACLNPRILDPEHGPRILKQEGWHYMLDEIDAPIRYSGVVYNEMKGVYSQPDQTNAKAVRHALFRGHPVYSIDSGGDPRAIPTLGYEAFASFHQTYYHPSNAFFYMYADPTELPHAERLALLDEYLQAYEAPAAVEAIPWQPLADQPYEVTKAYAVDADAAAAPTQFVTLAWLLNTAPLEPKTKLALSVLNDLLLGLPTAGLQVLYACMHACMHAHSHTIHTCVHTYVRTCSSLAHLGLAETSPRVAYVRMYVGPYACA